MTPEDFVAVPRGAFVKAAGGPYLYLGETREFGGNVGSCIRAARVFWYEITERNVEVKTGAGEWIQVRNVKKVLSGPEEVMAQHLERWLRDGAELP